MLAPLTDNFKDFSVIANIPYGVQSAQHQSTDKRAVQRTQHLFRSIGHYLTSNLDDANASSQQLN